MKHLPATTARAGVRRTTIADLLPVLEQWMIGFDRQAASFEQLYGALGRESGYPPYNLVSVGDDRYRLELAVAGFRRDELKVTATDTTLTIEGTKEATETGDGESVLHRGIAARNFRQTFALAEYVEVDNVSLTEGILTVELRRELPDKVKPREITIN